MNEWMSEKPHRICDLYRLFIAYLCLFTNRILMSACIRFTCRSHPGRPIFTRIFQRKWTNEATALDDQMRSIFFSFRSANPKSMTKTEIRRLHASIYYYNYCYWLTFAIHWRSSKIRLLRFRLYRCLLLEIIPACIVFWPAFSFFLFLMRWQPFGVRFFTSPQMNELEFSHNIGLYIYRTNREKERVDKNKPET